MSLQNTPTKQSDIDTWSSRLKTINRALSFYNEYSDASQLITCLMQVSDAHKELASLQTSLDSLNSQEQALVKENTELANKLTRLMTRVKNQR